MRANHLPRLIGKVIIAAGVAIVAVLLLAAIADAVIRHIRVKRYQELRSAAIRGDLASVKRCVAAVSSSKANPFSEGGEFFGSPAIVQAAWETHDEIVLFLLDHGADINSKDYCSNTALNASVYRRNTPMVKVLLTRGADPNIAGEGMPLDNAGSDTELVRLLESYGARHRAAR